MLEAPREMYGLIEEKFGPGCAKLALAIIIAGSCATGLLAIGALGYYTHTKIIAPTIKDIEWPSVSRIPEIGDFALSVIVTVALLAVAAYLVWRRFQRFRGVLVRVIHDVVGEFEAHRTFGAAVAQPSVGSCIGNTALQIGATTV